MYSLPFCSLLLSPVPVPLPHLWLQATFPDWGILKQVWGFVSDTHGHQIGNVYLLSNTEKKITH